jgi:hypothetical protein
MKSLRQNKLYTGVGGRKVPSNLLQLASGIGQSLAYKGYTLRSGAASGTDEYFEIGCDRGNGKKEIYLPSKGFNSHPSELYKVCDKALLLASEIHPAWNRLADYVKLLHARNCYQVLGRDLNTPSEFLVAATKNGEVVGGTATAINLALKNDIPVYNIGRMKGIVQFLLKLSMI